MGHYCEVPPFFFLTVTRTCFSEISQCIYWNVVLHLLAVLSPATRWQENYGL